MRSGGFQGFASDCSRTWGIALLLLCLSSREAAVVLAESHPGKLVSANLAHLHCTQPMTQYCKDVEGHVLAHGLMEHLEQEVQACYSGLPVSIKLHMDL